MKKLLKGVVLSVGCAFLTGLVAMVLAGNGLKAGVGMVLLVGAAVSVCVFLRTAFGAGSGVTKQRSKKNVWLNPGGEEWGPGSSHSSSPHGW